MVRHLTPVPSSLETLKLIIMIQSNPPPPPFLCEPNFQVQQFHIIFSSFFSPHRRVFSPSPCVHCTRPFPFPPSSISVSFTSLPLRLHRFQFHIMAAVVVVVVMTGVLVAEVEDLVVHHLCQFLFFEFLNFLRMLEILLSQNVDV
jgi:hypothetical protein